MKNNKDIRTNNNIQDDKIVAIERRYQKKERLYQERERLLNSFMAIRAKIEAPVYTTSQAIGILKISKRQIHYWLERVMESSGQDKKGPRVWSYFSILDICAFEIIKSFLTIDNSVTFLSKIVTEFKKHMTMDHQLLRSFLENKDILLIVDAHDVYLYSSLSEFGICYAGHDTLNKPVSLMSIWGALYNVFFKTKRDDFRLQEKSTGQTGVRDLYFEVDGKEIRLKKPTD